MKTLISLTLFAIFFITNVAHSLYLEPRPCELIIASGEAKDQKFFSFLLTELESFSTQSDVRSYGFHSTQHSFGEWLRIHEKPTDLWMQLDLCLQSKNQTRDRECLVSWHNFSQNYLLYMISLEEFRICEANVLSVLPEAHKLMITLDYLVNQSTIFYQNSTETFFNYRHHNHIEEALHKRNRDMETLRQKSEAKYFSTVNEF